MLLFFSYHILSLVLNVKLVLSPKVDFKASLKCKSSFKILGSGYYFKTSLTC